MSAPHPVIESWRVAVDVGNVHGPMNLAILPADGTMLVAIPSSTPAASGAGHQLEYWASAIGSWQPAGDRSATMRFEAIGVDGRGDRVRADRGAVLVDAENSGQGWSGPLTISIAGPVGETTATVSGTVMATRISP